MFFSRLGPSSCTVSRSGSCVRSRTAELMKIARPREGLQPRCDVDGGAVVVLADCEHLAELDADLPMTGLDAARVAVSREEPFLGGDRRAASPAKVARTKSPGMASTLP